MYIIVNITLFNNHKEFLVNIMYIFFVALIINHFFEQTCLYQSMLCTLQI